MKRRLTLKQRQTILKFGCLFLSVIMFIGSLVAIPFIVKALPRLGGTDPMGLLKDKPDGLPVFALGGGDFEYSFEEDDSTPETSDEISQEVSEIPPKPTPNEDDLFVTAGNLCWYEIGEEPELNLNNNTSYSVDLKEYLQKEFPIKSEITNQPLVLIIHTHGTESYLPTGYDFYSPDEDFRSEDERETVVHIGEVLSERLWELGIPNYHDKTMYDLNSFNDAYYNSYEGMKQALEKFPSIKYIIDLHRDSVFDTNGNNIKPLTQIEGEDCAQLMLVVGTDGYGTHPNWRQNLVFATYLQNKINQDYPTLARPLNLRNSGFNQSASMGGIILEAGSCGNTVEEVERSIWYFARSFSELLKEQMD